ncbi:MAG: DNA translocase FtsK [Myxococcales bacterium]|nr:DNA translocase FtsK [Myxococcales bacterium]
MTTGRAPGVGPQQEVQVAEVAKQTTTGRKRTATSKTKAADRRAGSAAGETPRRRASDRESEALRNEVFGIAVLAVAAALLLALGSFDPDDVSPTGMAATTGRAHNLIGPVGAFVADILLHVFGLAAFLLPLTLAAPGFAFLTGKRIRVAVGDAVGYPILVLFSAMAAYLWMNGEPVLGHDAGGLIGSTGGEILQALFGRTGAYLIVYAVIALTFIVTTRISLVGLAGKAAKPIAGQAVSGASEVQKASRGLLGGLGARYVAWKEERSERAAERATDRAEARASRKAQRAARAQARADQRQVTTDQVPAAKTPAKDADTPPGDAGEGPAEKRGLFGWALRRKPKPAPEHSAAPPADSGGFELGDIPVAEEEPAPVLRRRKGRKPQVERPTEVAPVLDAEDAGVELDDPLDAQAVAGEDHDTVLGTLAAIEADAPVRAKLDEPVVKRRRLDEKVEQLSIPLPEHDLHADYVKPPLHFLDYTDQDRKEVDPDRLRAQAERLVEALSTFRIEGRVTEIHPGPVVTMFEFEPAPGVRISRIANLADDLAMALKAVKVRIVAPIPGKGVVGFEVPNQDREMVYLKEIIGSSAFREKKFALPMALGKDIHGAPVITDLAKMPHLLVAGTTGSGKSVGVNGMITSLLYHANPDEVRFIMVDPKMLELSIYEGIPHLLLPVVTDPKKAAMSLKWAVDEMERRYELMKDAGVRDIRGYNRKVIKVLAEIELATKGGLDAETAPFPELWTEDNEPPTKLPYIVVVIDEFADLMMVAGKEVEYAVARIAQKARAAGIHLILATQRPSTDVITGVIKANFPTRMAFRVSSGIDSRTILSTNGAENLLGQGDMLFMPPGTSRLTRVHGAFVSEEEIHRIVEFIGAQQEPQYLDESVLEEDGGDDGDIDDGDIDPMYEEAVRVVARDGRASTSHLQRRLSLGYNRAARIVDQMERDGLVGPANGAKPRKVNKAVIGELVERWDSV